MKKSIPFLTPRMVGDRFNGHSIPLEVLKDLAVLEELIVEVAKWHYKNDHPDRKRTQRGFTDGVSLKLTGVDDGSAVPIISLFVTAIPELFPPENQECFERARNSIIAAINAAESGAEITEHLSDSHLAYFDRIGRSLRDGEAIEFDYKNPKCPARLTKATRRKLILASSGVREITEEVVLRGAIPEADQRKDSFELLLVGGHRIKAPLESQHYDVVLDAFNGYRKGVRVSLQGIAKYSRNERLQSIETVEHITILDSTDVSARLDEFRLLENGWLDGKGSAPSISGLNWLTDRFETLYPDSLPPPYLYPTAEGGIQAEWSVGGHDVSLEISLESHQGEWHDLELSTKDENQRELDLDAPGEWQWMTEQIHNIEGASQ